MSAGETRPGLNPDDLRSLADEIDAARSRYLDAVYFSDPADAKAALINILWDDKGTFAPALRLAASLGDVPEADEAFASTVVLQARKSEADPWINIYPAQLGWMAKEGYEVRALEAKS